MVIVAGAASRLWAFSQRGSLWLDEASLALNILTRGFGALATPLDWGQAAPIGFLWLLKAQTVVFSPWPWTLRLWPLIAGILTTALVWRVGRRVAGDAAALLATTAIALSLLAIRYSAEAKPYASDACIALALAWLALEVMDAPEDKGRWRRLRAAGVLAILFSLPSAFVLGAIGIALFPVARRAGKWPRLAVMAASTEWLLTFGIVWFVVVRASAGGEYLKEYWAPVMLDPSAPDILARIIRMLASVAATPLRWLGEIPFALAAIAAFLCGAYSIARRNASHAVLIVGPAALGALASVAGLYPMSDRLAYFAAPLALIASAACVAGAVRALTARATPRAQQAAIGVVTLAVAALTGTDAWRMVRAPGALEETMKPFLHARASARDDSSAVYVFARAAPAWVYATTDWRNVADERARLEFYRKTTGSVAHAAHENFARAGAVRVGEGDSLRVAGSPLELVGLAPGVRYRIAGPTSRDGVAPGWAEEEARRIAATAAPAIWIVASHFFEGTPRDELAPLIAALQAKGFTIVGGERGGRDAVTVKLQR
jgi:hypothetical protein